MQNPNSPCVSDALYGTKTITVKGRSVGIVRLCDAVANVQALGLTQDDEIKAALIRSVEEKNFIPDALRAEYADALLAEYYVFKEQSCRGER